MNSLPLEILIKILSSISLSELYVFILSDDYTSIIERITSSEEFWKRKIKLLFYEYGCYNLNLDDHSYCWSKVYCDLSGIDLSSKFLIKLCEERKYEAVAVCLLGFRSYDFDDELLEHCAEEGDHKFAKLLLEDPKADTWHINRAIISALNNEHFDVVKVLLKDERFDPAADDNEAIHHCALCNDPWGLKLLLQDRLRNRVNPAARNNLFIQCASKKGNYESAKRLLQDARVDPSANNNLAIRSSAGKGHYKIVKLLLKDVRVDPSADNNAAIRSSAGNGHHKIVKLLLKDDRVDPNADDNYAICLASQRGHHKTVKLLLHHRNINVNGKDHYSIQVSSKNGHINVVKLLLMNADVNPSINNNSAIKLAAKNGHTEILRLLLEDKRVNLSIQDNNELLQLAIKNGHKKIVRMLKYNSGDYVINVF